jgi:release factor glutamine methyltransferase
LRTFAVCQSAILLGNLANRRSLRHNRDVLPTPSASPPKTVWAVLDVLRWTTAHFEKHGVASARLDAELLAAHAFGMSRIELYAHFDRPLAAAELASYRELVSRRLAGESVAYLLGHKEFWSLDLLVDSRVLVPRPDSETLVEEALDRLAGPSAGLRIADVGTGSGALALALAKERPEAQVFATDISPDALAVARSNAERLSLTVTFLEGDLAQPLVPLDRFDLIVANLPYIPSAEIDGLAADVRGEPRLALDGGADGLALLRRLVAGAPERLRLGGCLALEVGAGQAGAVEELLGATGLGDVRRRRDLAGIERVVSGLKGTSS